MKSNSMLVFLILIPFFGINAQSPIIVTEDSLKIGNSQLPCLAVTIPEAIYEKTLKVWIKELQLGTTSKVITENNEMWIFGANIKSISNNPINVYSKIIQLDSLLLLFATFELKKDQYAERNASENDFANAVDYIKEFSKTQYVDLAKDEAKDEEKRLRNLQKELSSLENEKSRMLKSIDSNRKKIIRERENLVEQNNNLTAASATLAQNNSQYVNMGADPAKEKMKLIKELEREKKKAMNSIKSSEKMINKAESEIDKATDDIPNNERRQLVLKERISQQEAIYERFADKLKNIKSY